MEDGVDHTLVTDCLVGLYTGEPDGCDPLDGLTGRGNAFSALGEPVFNIIGISEEITDTLYGDASQILRGLVKLSICLVHLLVLELSLDLLPRSDEGHTIHTGHDSLLDDLTDHFTLKRLSYLLHRWVLLIINLLDDELKNSRVDITRSLRVS